MLFLKKRKQEKNQKYFNLNQNNSYENNVSFWGIEKFFFIHTYTYIYIYIQINDEFRRLPERIFCPFNRATKSPLPGRFINSWDFFIVHKYKSPSREPHKARTAENFSVSNMFEFNTVLINARLALAFSKLIQLR